MTTSRTLMLLAAGLGAAALSGCGANVPENPTWVADVHPIMVARCIRCHDATLGESDPLSMMGAHAIGNFSYASFSDFSDTDKNLVIMSGDQVSKGLMPLAPAAKLADWQIETLQRWSKNPM